MFQRVKLIVIFLFTLLIVTSFTSYAADDSVIYLPFISTPVPLLPNPSFEDGWYRQDGIPELMIPNQWLFEYDTGPTGFGDNAWDVYVRPETRVLSASFLPPAEQALFIWNGNHTFKVFKASGAISFRLLTDVYLEPGTYQMEFSVFPDLVIEYDGGGKVWATDPTSGEVRFVLGDGGTDFVFPTFGQKNTYTHTFTIDSAQTVRLGVGIRGRFPIMNNGWYMDDWSLEEQ